MSTARCLLLLFGLEVCAVTGTALGAAGGSSNEKGNTVDVTVSHSVSITRTMAGGAFPSGFLSTGAAQRGGGSPVLPPQPPDPVLPTPDGEGGHLGDRCPDAMKDEHGNFPSFCYDVIDAEGACLLDDIVAPKDTCILWYGQDFYDEMVELQQEIERNRTEATDNTNSSSTTPPPEDGLRAAEVDASAPAAHDSRRSEKALGLERRGEFQARLGEGSNILPALAPGRTEVVRRDGPSFNIDALNSLGYLETQQVGPTLGYFQSLSRSLGRRDSGVSLPRQQRSDGPQFNTGVLDSLGYLETQQVGPTLGYFQSLRRLRRHRGDDDVPPVQYRT